MLLSNAKCENASLLFAYGGRFTCFTGLYEAWILFSRGPPNIVFVLYKNRKKIEILSHKLFVNDLWDFFVAGNITGKLIAARTACLDVGRKHSNIAKPADNPVNSCNVKEMVEWACTKIVA